MGGGCIVRTCIVRLQQVVGRYYLGRDYARTRTSFDYAPTPTSFALTAF